MTIAPCPLLMAAAAAESVGYWFGVSLIPLGLAFGIYKCAQIARRDIASAKCAVGLALVLFAMLSFALLGVADLAGHDVEDSGLVMALSILAGISALVGTIVALVGLVQYPRIKPPLRQGRRQAILALLLGGGLLALMAWGALSSADLEAALDQSPIAGLGHTKPQTFDELNFRFDAPPLGWFRLDPQTLNEDAAVAYARLNREIYFMLIAERLGAERGMTSDDLREIVEQNLKDAYPDARAETARVIHHRGLKGSRFSAVTRGDGIPLCYDYQVFVHNGFGYQLVTWGQQSARAAVVRDSEAMAGLFHCIDLERTTVAEGTTLLESHASPRLGYEVRFPGGGWHTDGDLRDLYAEEDLVAMYRDDCWLSVIAMPLPDAKVPDEGILQALLALKNFNAAAEEVREKTQTGQDDRTETRFVYEQDVEGTRIHSRARMIRANGLAYLVQVDRESADAAADEMQRTALEWFRLTAPTPPEPSAVRSERELETTARFFNQIGLYFYRAENFLRAKEWFLRACELPGVTATFVDNGTQALIELGEHDEALAHLERHRELFREDLDLRGDRAWLLSLAGRNEEARREYATLFAGGLRDDDDLAFYVGLLVEADDAKAALELLKDYRAEADNPKLLTVHTGVLLSIGQPNLARKMLEEQPEPRPDVVVDALLDVYEATGEYEKVVAAADKLIAAEYSYPKLYRSKSRAEIALGRCEEAARTAAIGLENCGENEELAALAAQAKAGAGRK